MLLCSYGDANKARALPHIKKKIANFLSHCCASIHVYTVAYLVQREDIIGEIFWKLTPCIQNGTELLNAWIQNAWKNKKLITSHLHNFNSTKFGRGTTFKWSRPP
ncbi:unnamed protein product [Pipistrellus nathusii]|uniref:Transposase n=1 Tax=Pipistrellus nathusii TaxID=59473 RepID=A0ABN9Z471_PIPNA